MKTLRESLLDDEDVILGDADKSLFKDWIKNNIKGDYKFTTSKIGIYKFNGDLIIKDFKEVHLPENLKIKEIKGSLHISKCPNLTNIRGLFESSATVENFSINNCPKLTSLEGSPLIVHNNFTCINNSSLKTLIGAPQMANSVGIMKNGKKFKEEEIRKYIQVFERVDCNLEDYSEVLSESIIINETLNEPHLLKLADQLKKYYPSTKLDFKTVLGKYTFSSSSTALNIQWDEIDASNVKEGRPDVNMLKLARKIIAGQTSGIILTLNSDYEYSYLISANKTIIKLPTKRSEESNSKYQYPIYTYKSESSNSTELIETCKDAWRLVIITTNDLSTWKLTNQRAADKQGMINPGDEKQYRELAAANIKRYKKILSERKTRRGADDLIKIDDAVNNILMRFMKLTRNMHMNPEKYKGKSYDVQQISEAINQSPNKFNSWESGLMTIYEQLCTNYTRIINNETYSDTNDYELRKIEDYKKSVREKVSDIDMKLKVLGV